MNILYLHGLHSKLATPKKIVLEKYGRVFAPHIDYSKKHFQPQAILNRYPETEFNVVIGSSMGALNSYAISEIIGRPALLFNPPMQKYGAFTGAARFVKGLSPKYFVLGGSDEIVKPGQSLNFLNKYLNQNEVELKIIPQLGHRIPLDVFEETTRYFFSQICY